MFIKTTIPIGDGNYSEAMRVLVYSSPFIKTRIPIGDGNLPPAPVITLSFFLYKDHNPHRGRKETLKNSVSFLVTKIHNLVFVCKNSLTFICFNSKILHKETPLTLHMRFNIIKGDKKVEYK